jgi:hypothetical protein
MRAGEDTVGADILAIDVCRERLDLIPAIRNEDEQALHPIGILREAAHIG